MDVNNNLQNFFEIEPVKETEVKQETKQGVTGCAIQDYEFARKNLRGLIDSGSEGLKGIMKVAMESDSPRAYEVLGNMIKTLADINVNLMDVSAKFAETNKVTVKNNTTNSIFVGTTKDLQNLIKKQNEVVEVDINEQSEKRLQIESES